MRLFGALLLVLFSSGFYKLAGTPEDASEWFYCTQGVTCAVLFAYAARRAPAGIVAAVLWWGAFEQAQVAVCGIGAYGIKVPLASGLCVERFGLFPYLVVFTIAIAYIWFRNDRQRHREHGRSGGNP